MKMKNIFLYVIFSVYISPLIAYSQRTELPTTSEIIEIIYKEISTPEEFDEIRNDLAGNYKLTADIELSYFEPIGSLTEAFTGCLDGNGFQLCVLSFKSYQGENNALFRYARNASFRDLLITGGVLEGKDYTATLVSRCAGTTFERIGIEDIYLKTSGKVAGLVCITESGEETLIKDCYIKNTVVLGEGLAAGFVGIANDIRIENSYFYGRAVNHYYNEIGEPLSLHSAAFLYLVNNENIILRGCVYLGDPDGIYGTLLFVSLKEMATPLAEKSSCYTTTEVKEALDLFPHPDYPGMPDEGHWMDFADFTRTQYEKIGWDFEKVWAIGSDGLPGFKDRIGETSVKEKPSSLQEKNTSVTNLGDGAEITVRWPAIIKIYTLSGILIRQLEINEKQLVALLPGTYIYQAVSVEKTETGKIYVGK
ncbi:MAG: hypothetical protein LUG18_05145 [Candidatus Azobacteroides sp.]|nr:hypothetical protein [Candidatus Azobacteroides sp.]